MCYVCLRNVNETRQLYSVHSVSTFNGRQLISIEHGVEMNVDSDARIET